MASMVLKSTQELAYFDGLIAQFRESVSSFGMSVLSGMESSSNATPTKITGTLSTGEKVVILGKFGASVSTITDMSITNPNTGSKITSSMSWTLMENGEYSSDYGLSTAFFKGYSYEFTNAAGKKIAISESFDKLMFDASNAELTNYKFTVSDGYGGSASLVAEALSMNTYLLLSSETSFADMLDIVGADASMFIGNDVLDSAQALTPQFMNGHQGDDRMTGSKNDDYLDGGAGADTMKGGLGNDIYYVDSIGDKIIEAAKQGTDTINTTISLTLANNIENITAIGTGDIGIKGSKVVNVVIGNAGNNVLNGDLGSDTLTGGGGSDTFVFDTKLGTGAKLNKDAITDFATTIDKIQLENSVFTALKTAGALAEMNFAANSTGQAIDKDDYIIYNTTTGVLSFDVDGSGGKAVVEFAQLTGINTISAADFQII